MNKITSFCIQKDGTRIFHRWTMEEVVEELKHSKFRNIIIDFRLRYPLLLRETPAVRNNLINRMLDGIPQVCVSAEFYRRNGEDVTVGYNPLLMLTVSNLRSEAVAEKLRNHAAALPYTRLAFVGITGTTVVIVCKLQALGTQPESAADYTKLLERGFASVRKVYSDHLHVTVDTIQPSLYATCHISLDHETYYNPISTPFPVSMTGIVAQTIGGIPYTVAEQVKDREEMYRWRRIYIDNLSKAQLATFRSADHAFETLLLLARYCHDTGMPQALAESFAMMNGEFRDCQSLVRDTFATEYEKELRESCPEKHLNTTAQLMLRTSNFLNVHFRFRRNVLNGIVEYRLNDGTDFAYHLLTKEVQNSMTIMALESGLNSWDKDLSRYIHSNRIPEYDPVNTYLDSLPKWDGKDRVAAFARRVPTDTPDWERNLHIWMLSMVAHWMGRDEQHGNAIAPILIGAQATGKSSFCRIILPEPLLDYYNDSIHFKDDKSVFLALSSFCLINIDEFDSLSRTQQPLLKYLLSKTDVKYRSAYRNHIEQHKRYASFIGTTNNLHPLTDPTGSRRFICVKVKGTIDCATPVDHAQLYAQLRDEVLQGERYWFTKVECDTITRQNIPFQRTVDLSSMLRSIYRQPRPDDDYTVLTVKDIIDELLAAYPNMEFTGQANTQVGIAMRDLGFQPLRTHSSRQYHVVRRATSPHSVSPQ